MKSLKFLINQIKSLRKQETATEKFLLAHKYNSMYFDTHNPECRWMCPICNKVHYPKQINGFVGSIFDPCCDFPAGPRNTKTSAIKKKFSPFWK